MLWAEGQTMKRWYEDSVGFHLTRAARVHRARAQGLLAEIGLHPGQETVLQALTSEDGMAMTRLAETLHVKPPTVTKMVARMAAQGLVTRVASQTDGRSAGVHLTEDGRARANDLKRRWRKLEEATLRDLSDKDRRKLLRVLQTIGSSLAGDGTS